MPAISGTEIPFLRLVAMGSADPVGRSGRGAAGTVRESNRQDRSAKACRQPWTTSAGVDLFTITFASVPSLKSPYRFPGCYCWGFQGQTLRTGCKEKYETLH